MKYTWTLCDGAVTWEVSTDTFPFQATMEGSWYSEALAFFILVGWCPSSITCYLQAIFGDFSMVCWALWPGIQQMLCNDPFTNCRGMTFLGTPLDMPHIRGAVESEKKKIVSLTSLEKSSIRTGLRNKQQTLP